MSGSSKRPVFDIEWIRFAHTKEASLAPAFKEPSVFAVYGDTGEGKSNIVETCADHYPLVLDLFGSRDNEGLAWLRSHRADAALLLHGDSVKISFKKRRYDTMTVSEFCAAPWRELFKYKVIISVSAFYGTQEEEWYSMARIFNKLWNRESYTKETIVGLIIREAANFLYSRLAIGDTQGKAKAYVAYTLKEIRHHGFSLSVDSVRWFDIDISIRKIAHYTFLKAQGIEGLPKGLEFLYSWFDPYGVMQMGIEKFIIFHRKGALGYGSTTCSKWHAQAEEHLRNLFGIETDAVELPQMGKAGNVGDYEHVEFVELRAATRPDGRRLSFEKIAELKGRSSKTPHKHISQHNTYVERAGECPKCARVRSKLARVVVT